MKYLKSYKRLFENKLDINEVVSDIKSISYILEDDGYELKCITKDESIELSSTVDMYGHTSPGKIPKFDIQLVLKLPREVCWDVMGRSRIYLNELVPVILKKEPEIVKFHDDSNHFFTLLKEHLDYISDIKLDILTTVAIIEINL